MLYEVLRDRHETYNFDDCDDTEDEIAFNHWNKPRNVSESQQVLDIFTYTTVAARTLCALLVSS